MRVIWQAQYLETLEGECNCLCVKGSKGLEAFQKHRLFCDMQISPGSDGAIS